MRALIAAGIVSLVSLPVVWFVLGGATFAPSAPILITGTDTEQAVTTVMRDFYLTPAGWIVLGIVFAGTFLVAQRSRRR